MFSIRSTCPPEKFPFKDAIQRMWTAVYFEPVGPKQTRVVCCGMGFGDDDESQRMRGFFERGNGWTLEKLKEKFAGGRGAAGHDATPRPSEQASK